MNTCAVQNVATLRAADHICVWDKSRWPFRYTHHGVVFEEGASAEQIVIAHVWSNEPGFRASQRDSRFRLTSLAEFLNGRPVRDMRRVQYNSSLLGDALSRLGEVHRARSDPPPIVLARCRFLLGLGQGHFSIVSLNCEHVALWCKTGVVWSKQLMQKAYGRAPYVPAKDAKHALAPLEATLKTLRADAQRRNEQLQALHGRRVYLRVGAAKFVKRLGDGRLYLVHNDPTERDMAFRQHPTTFILHVDVEAYNCVTVMFRVADVGVELITGSVSSSSIAASSSSAIVRSSSSCSVMTSSRSNVSAALTGEEDKEDEAEEDRAPVAVRTRATTAAAESAQARSAEHRQRPVFIYPGANSVKLVPRRRFHRESLFRFEYGWDGELQSRRNRRWYVGAQTRDGLLRTFNSRDHATSFQIVDADAVDSESVEIDSVDAEVEVTIIVAAAATSITAATTVTSASCATGVPAPEPTEKQHGDIAQVDANTDGAEIKTPAEINGQPSTEAEVMQQNVHVG